MNIRLDRVDNEFRMKASNERGDFFYTDGSSKIGASGRGWRPMELLLVSLAGCSSIDVISVLKKQRQFLKDIRVEISGTKREGIPSPYETINLHFSVSGQIKASKIERAIELTKEKYCSVYFSLHPDIEVNYTYSITEA